MLKTQPPSTSARMCVQLLHHAFSRFWTIWAYFGPNVLRFLWWGFFSCVGDFLKLLGIDQQCLGKIWAKISPYLTPIAQKNCKKRDRGGKKTFIFFKKAIKPLGKMLRTQKNILQKSFFFSELQQLEFVCCAASVSHFYFMEDHMKGSTSMPSSWARDDVGPDCKSEPWLDFHN